MKDPAVLYFVDKLIDSLNRLHREDRDLSLPDDISFRALCLADELEEWAHPERFEEET